MGSGRRAAVRKPFPWYLPAASPRGISPRYPPVASPLGISHRTSGRRAAGRALSHNASAAVAACCADSAYTAAGMAPPPPPPPPPRDATVVDARGSAEGTRRERHLEEGLSRGNGSRCEPVGSGAAGPACGRKGCPRASAEVAPWGCCSCIVLMSTSSWSASPPPSRWAGAPCGTLDRTLLVAGTAVRGEALRGMGRSRSDSAGREEAASSYPLLRPMPLSRTKLEPDLKLEPGRVRPALVFTGYRPTPAIPPRRDERPPTESVSGCVETPF